MTKNFSKNECYWTAVSKSKAIEFSEFSGGIDIDVAVIGGGIVGLTTAEKLLSSGKKVAVFEAGLIGHGATGRSTAKITSQHNIAYSRIEKKIDSETARIYAEANQAAIEQIAMIVDKYGIDCDFERSAAYVYTPKIMKKQNRSRMSLRPQENSVFRHL